MAYPNQGNNNVTGAIPVYIASGSGGAAVTPMAATASSIATGGVAVVIATGPLNGGFITNPPNAASQGISTVENCYVDMVGTPGSADSAANGTTVLLQPGQSFSIPALAAGVNVRANAATSGHKLSVEVW